MADKLSEAASVFPETMLILIEDVVGFEVSNKMTTYNTFKYFNEV